MAPARSDVLAIKALATEAGGHDAIGRFGTGRCDAFTSTSSALPQRAFARRCIRIVMLVASSPDHQSGGPGSSVAPLPIFRYALALRPSRMKASSSTQVGVSVPSGGRIDSQGADPSTWRFQGCFIHGSVRRCSARELCRSRSFQMRRAASPGRGCPAFLRIGHRSRSIQPTIARHSLHLRSARSSHGAVPKNFSIDLQGAFSDAAAGIAFAPIGLKFPIIIQGFIPE